MVQVNGPYSQVGNLDKVPGFDIATCRVNQGEDLSVCLSVSLFLPSFLPFSLSPSFPPSLWNLIIMILKINSFSKVIISW